MGIELRNAINGTKGTVQAYEKDKVAGEIFYTLDQDQMVIEHTEVDPAFGGKGIGKKLVNGAVAYAREHHLKINPLCPFAHKILTADGQYQDVLA